MGKFANILIASDFDHTLTNSNNEIPSNNINAIRYFMDEGGTFTVASGRSIPLFRDKAALVPKNAPCILYNGAVRYDYSTETLQACEPLPEDFAPSILEAALAYDNTLCLEIQDLEHHYVFRPESYRAQFLCKSGLDAVAVTENPPFPWIKIVIGDFDARVLESYDAVPQEKAEAFRKFTAYLAEFCRGKCYVDRSMPRVLEIGSATASKGIAARKLAQELGNKTLVCIGDAMNDYSMLREADFAFCPADCDPALKNEPFCRLTVPCAEGSVAAVIQTLEKML